MPFLLTTCSVGAERVLRKILLEQAGLRPAFARPGMITFKCEEEVSPESARPHPLVRTWGVSLGFAKGLGEFENALAKLDRPVLQVLAGEAGPKGHVPPLVLASWTNLTKQVEEEIVAKFGTDVRTCRPERGDPVLEVIVRPNEAWILSWHIHGQGRGPFPGAAWELKIPEDAPSRSWTKLEELLQWSGAKLKSGESVLEIGCSPGGATMAMLDRGLKVCSIDPRPVVLPERLSQAPFVQHYSLIETLPRNLFPKKVDWIVVDMGVSAPIAVHALSKVVPMYRHTIKGMLITLKLNEWELAERIPELLEKIRRFGFRHVEAACLPSFRQEIGVVAQ